MLKIIACLSMLIDHVGYVFFPGQLWLRILGRIAFPLFAWYVAAGFDRTRNRGRYLTRMILWGLVSQIPFAMLFHGGSLRNVQSLFLQGTNVLFTFALALGGLWMLESSRRQGLAVQFLAWVAMGVLAVTASLMKTDYGAYGVVMVLLFHLGEKRQAADNPPLKVMKPETDAVVLSRRTGWRIVIWRVARRLSLPVSLVLWTWVCLAPMRMHPIQLYCVAAIPLLWLRLPDWRPGRWKYAFYAFYPFHIAVLWVLATFVFQ